MIIFSFFLFGFSFGFGRGKEDAEKNVIISELLIWAAL